MTFPETPRVVYRQNPLAEVVAQLNFPSVLKIDSESPAAFQEAIRGEYPFYELVSSGPQLPPNLPSQMANFVQFLTRGAKGPPKHQFATQNKTWQVTLTRETIELKTKAYIRWEDFRDRLMRIRDVLDNEYRPAAFVRVGLRYLNLIRQDSLGMEAAPWSDLLNHFIAGELAAPEMAGGIDSVTRQLHCQTNAENCYLTLKTGIVIDDATKKKCFLIDSDFHTHKPPEDKNVFNTLNTFNRIAGGFFRWCIRERLHEALGPGPVDER
jgi:uncharacterized protein (TIGR04255 family)